MLVGVPSKPYRPRELRYELFRGSLAISSLVLTAEQLRSDAWIRLDQDVYADARLARDHELACRAAALRLPAEAAFAGPSAAYLLGVKHAAGPADPVHVVVPPDLTITSRARVKVHHVELLRGDVRHGGELPHTTPNRTVWDLATWFDPEASVPVIDSLLAGGVVNQESARAYIASRRGQRGCRRAEKALAMSDGLAQSRPESVLRVRLILAGLPRPIAQHAVRVGSVVLHPDLAWPEYHVAIEYDGVWHADAAQLRRDRRRLNLLVASGWIVLHVTSDRLWRDFGGLTTEVRATLRSRGWSG
jgi:very-short-patch-repair endonuclease